jgi:hypothetical protein
VGRCPPCVGTCRPCVGTCRNAGRIFLLARPARLLGRFVLHRALRRARPVLAFVLAGAWGCALVAGVDFDRARGLDPRTVSDSAVFGEGGTPIVQGGCPPERKVCNGACFPKEDPAYGCGGECTPCSLAHATRSRCGIGGACIPEACEPGFDDCDHDPANGCETDLTRPDTCGSCANKCAPGMLCAPSGCVEDCPGDLVPCGGSCVNTMTSSLHCGGCDRPCPAGAANADPACLTGTCGITCRAGFADCASTPPTACAPLPKWYVDSDGDEYGTEAFAAACARPAGHAPNSGDCLDSNPAVHPSAAPSEVGFAGPTGLSYDYDCSGTEVEENAPVHWSGACQAGCTGNGFVPLSPPRPGPGVNNYCGSPTQHVCFTLPPSGGCTSIDYDAGIRIKCN